MRCEFTNTALKTWQSDRHYSFNTFFLWHLTIGHPLNPILTMGDLLCTGVEVSFPDDTLSYGDFPTTIKATVKLKPAKPRDRAGIEMMFNHGQKRIYMPAVVKVVKDSKLTSRERGLWDKYIDEGMNYVAVKAQKGQDAINTIVPVVCDEFHQLNHSISPNIKYAQDKWNDGKGWVHNKANPEGKPISKYIIQEVP